MPLYEAVTKVVIANIYGEIKIVLFSDPLYLYDIRTIPTYDKDIIMEIVETFNQRLANTYRLIATTMTIYENVPNVDNLVLRLETLYHNDELTKAFPNSIRDGINTLQSRINDAYADSSVTRKQIM